MAKRTHIPTATGHFEVLHEGDAGAPLVLCLHGFPDFAPTFETMLGGLAEAGFYAAAPWLRGYAPSVLEGPFTQEQLKADVLSLIDVLGKGKPVYLVGHDWGAAIAQSLLSEFPARFVRAVTMAVPHQGVFFENALGHPAQFRRSWYMGLFQLPAALVSGLVRKDNFALIDRLWRDWSPGFSVEPAYMQALKRCLDASMPGPVLYYSSYFQPISTALSRIRMAKSMRISVPALSLMGERDGCIGPEIAKGQEAFFDGPFESEIISNAGHFLHLEKADAVSARIVQWLKPGSAGA